MSTSLWSGQRLREHRARAGLTQQQLAAKSGYDIARICAYENNRLIPKLDSLGKLADALGVEPAELLVSAAERQAQP